MKNDGVYKICRTRWFKIFSPCQGDIFACSKRPFQPCDVCALSHTHAHTYRRRDLPPAAVTTRFPLVWFVVENSLPAFTSLPRPVASRAIRPLRRYVPLRDVRQAPGTRTFILAFLGGRFILTIVTNIYFVMYIYAYIYVCVCTRKKGTGGV